MRAKEKKHFRQKLLEKRAELIGVVQKTEDYGRQVNAEAEGMDLADKASSSYTKEFMFSKSDGDRQLLQEVVDALRRLDEGDFGKCINCRRHLSPKTYLAVLDSLGEELTSPQLASSLADLMNRGVSEVTFLVGSHLGIPKRIKNLADLKLSLTKLTLPHELARVVLLEQIYRAVTIIKGLPYHK